MRESEWLNKAKRIHKECADTQKLGNGSKKITMSEAHTLNDLQHAIGSHHGIRLITYNEARESLDEMFDMVKSGRKTPPLTKG